MVMMKTLNKLIFSIIFSLRTLEYDLSKYTLPTTLMFDDCYNSQGSYFVNPSVYGSTSQELYLKVVPSLPAFVYNSKYSKKTQPNEAINENGDFYISIPISMTNCTNGYRFGNIIANEGKFGCFKTNFREILKVWIVALMLLIFVVFSN